MVDSECTNQVNITCASFCCFLIQVRIIRTIKTGIINFPGKKVPKSKSKKPLQIRSPTPALSHIKSTDQKNTKPLPSLSQLRLNLLKSGHQYHLVFLLNSSSANRARLASSSISSSLLTNNICVPTGDSHPRSPMNRPIRRRFCSRLNPADHATG